MIRLLLLFLVFALPVHAAGGALSNVATGISGIYTEQRRISDHPHHVLMGHVIVVTRDGTVARALVIRHRRDGVHRLRFGQAWAAGHRLPWQRETGPGCTHGHCRDGPVGMIVLPEALFDRALRHGLAARLIGPSGAVDIHAPASLFRDAAARAAGM